MIAAAARLGAEPGLAVWTQDEAGPCQTGPYPGGSWRPPGRPAHQPPEYVRAGTAKLLPLFHPASGQVRVQGVTRCTHQVRQPWLQEELLAVLAALPPATPGAPRATQAAWAAWQAGRRQPSTLPDDPPPLRRRRRLDHPAGHTTAALGVWLLEHGVLPRYTPLGGSWPNMAASIRRVRKRRALDGTHPATPLDSIAQRAATARGWTRDPPPCVRGGTRRVAPARAPSGRSAAARPAPHNGNAHANRPTSGVSGLK